MQEIESIIALNGDYKAVIYKENEHFIVAVYRWSEEDLDDQGNNLWSRERGPFQEPNLESAQKTANEQLQVITGEIPEANPPKEITDIVDEFIEAPAYIVTKGEAFEVYKFNELKTPISFERIIIFDQFYLIQTDNAWHSGILIDTYTIHTFQNTPDLKELLERITSEEA